MTEKCQHEFIQKTPGVQRLLEEFDSNSKAISIEMAHDILINCPECAIFFYQEVLALLKEFVPKNKKTNEEKKEYILPWTMNMLGYTYKEIEKKFNIPETTAKDRVYKVYDYLIRIGVAFYEN